MSNIDNTLAERGSRYGEFTGHADITQNLKKAMNSTPKWAALADDQKEALEMVAHKIGRILNGDPNYIDSWTDIIGYTRLVEKRLIGEQAVQKEFTYGCVGTEPQCANPQTPIAKTVAAMEEARSKAAFMHAANERARKMSDAWFQEPIKEGSGIPFQFREPKPEATVSPRSPMTEQLARDLTAAGFDVKILG